MQLYSTTKKPLNERFTKIMKQRKKLKIFEEIEIQVNVRSSLWGAKLFEIIILGRKKQIYKYEK